MFCCYFFYLYYLKGLSFGAILLLILTVAFFASLLNKSVNSVSLSFNSAFLSNFLIHVDAIGPYFSNAS